MTKLVLLIDFGSTYSKLSLVDPLKSKVLYRTKLPTSSKIGLEDCYEKGKKEIFDALNLDPTTIALEEIFCSSAWGGFKMVAIGLTESLTAEAARRAALGAGTRILKTFFYRLKLQDIEEMNALKPDVVLLTGGSNGGNKEIIIENAKLLATHLEDIAIIVAGNQQTYPTLKTIFQDRTDVFYTENVMPQVNSLNPLPVRQVTQDIFMKKIIESKGINEVASHSKLPIIPTPVAVLKAAKLLKEGTANEAGLGEVLVLDIGGATTDVHTIGDNQQTQENIFFEGLAEPYLKRTVEGDIGMRYSAASLVDVLGLEETLTRLNNPYWTKEKIKAACDYRKNHPDYIAATKEEKQFDQFLGKTAANISVKRHVGKLRKVKTPTRDIYYQTGKDLRNFKVVIGTGGILVYNQTPLEILKNTLYENINYLLPKKPQFFIDTHYLLSAMGLLSQVYPETALKILKTSLKKVY